MKTPNEATVEEIINDLAYWEEDLNSSLLLHGTKYDGVSIYHIEGDIYGEGTTIKEALINFGKAFWNKNHWDGYAIDWSK